MEEITYQGYKEFKIAMDTEIKEAAQGFVRIGYLLKLARDTEVLYESGYPSVAEFAKAEYGLTKDIVSRYIAINDRYSENGYSDRLQGQYEAYGVAKLGEMLTLSDEVIESLSPQLTRAQIQEVKKEIKEEEAITDLEVMMEDTTRAELELNGNLEKFLFHYFQNNGSEYKELYKSMHKSTGTSSEAVKKIIEVLAPSGIGVLMERIPGSGKYMLSIKGEQEPPELLNVRSNEKQAYAWGDMVLAVKKLFGQADGMEENFKMLYGEPLEEKKTEVAPVQPNQEQKTGSKMPENRITIKRDAISEPETKNPEKSGSKMPENVINIKADIDSEPEEKKEPIPAAEQTKTQPEEQIPGQDSIDNHEDWLPEDRKPVNSEYEMPENVINTLCDAISIDEKYRENALEYSELYITESIKGWENETIPLEELDKLIENTKQLEQILKMWKREREEVQ